MKNAVDYLHQRVLAMKEQAILLYFLLNMVAYNMGLVLALPAAFLSAQLVLAKPMRANFPFAFAYTIYNKP